MRRRWILLTIPVLLGLVAWWWRTPPDAAPVHPAETAVAAQESAAEVAPAASDTPEAPAQPGAATRQVVAMAVPHRAPPSVQIDDQQRLQTDPDLPALAIELTERAERGDADAAYAMNQLLRLCGVRADIESGPLPAVIVWEVVAEGAGAERVPALQAQYAQTVRRCGTLAELEGNALYDRIRGWARRAAELGHTRARLEAAQDEEERRAAAAELLKSDPSIMVAEASRLGTLTGYGRYGWIMAGCLLDAACAPNPLAMAERSIAITGVLGDGSYADLLNLGPRQLQIARAQAEEILALYRESRWDLLLAPRVRR